MNILNTTFGPWDFVLLTVVSLQATLLAYLYHPKWKAFILSLPIPFTLATLAVGRPVDATNALGLLDLLLFTHGLRLLHYRLRVPIILSILISAAGYCVLGWILAGAVPSDGNTFWITAILTMIFALMLYKYSPAKDEPGHRSPCPVYLKLPIIAGVILGLIFIKKSLHGFTTVFPMVGVVAAYEARTCLWTICRQIPVLMLGLVPLMMVCRLAQPNLGLATSLAIGWIVSLAVLIPLTPGLWLNKTEIES